MLETHRRHVADVTVAVTPVSAEQAPAFGILKVNRQGRIVHFEEKPKPERLPDLVSEVPGFGPRYPRLDGHLHLRARGARARRIADRELVDFGQTRDPRGGRRACACRPTSTAATGRTSGRSAPTTRPTWRCASPMPPFDFYDAGAARLHPPALPARDQDRGLRACSSALISEGVHPGGGGDRARGGRDPQPHRARDAQYATAWCWAPTTTRRLEEIEPRRGARPAAHRHRRRTPSIEHAIVDKNARVGPRRPHRQRGGRTREGRPGLLHPRRDRDRAARAASSPTGP